MPRQARKKSPTGLYHVMLRGADRRILFADDEDCCYFLAGLQRAKAVSEFKLYAYCLMGNHVHLLMREDKEPLEIGIKRLGVSYVYYYNEKYELLGHLFQDRFRSEPIDSIWYFLDVLRYICQNPVKAGLCRIPQDYRWLGCAGLKDDFNLVDDLKDYSQLGKDDLEEFIRGACKEEHLDETFRERLTDREAIRKLCGACGCEHVQQIGGWPKADRDRALQQGLQAGISIRQLSRITGLSRQLIRVKS